MASRRVAVLLVLALFTAACGARLTDEERAAGISSLSAGGEGGTEAAPGDGDAAGDEVFTGDQGATQAGTTGGDSTARRTGGASGSQPGTAGGEGGESGGDRGGAQGTAAPEQCQGGQSDVGVSPDQIVIATVADVTGPSPGLFKSAHQAVQAYANMVNSQGGVCGRQIRVVQLDSKTDSGGNRAAVLEACNKAFALVGNMSAFDQGGASAVDECGIPDLNAIVTSPERLNAEHGFATFPSRQDLLAVGNPTYLAQKHPDAVKNAGILWLNAAATRNNARARQAAWEKVGFEFVYEREVQVLEANYTQFVLQMEQAGVEYVTMVADNSSIARLMKAAKQQGWAPEIWDWDSVAYDPGFITEAGDAAEGARVFINTAMLEEGGAVPEMAKYTEWIQRSFPGTDPDYFGIYGWSSAALFVEKLKAMGPEPTRAAFLDHLRNTREWNGFGIHGPQDVGGEIPTTCFLFMQIRGGKFVREYPTQLGAWDCDLAGRVEV